MKYQSLMLPTYLGERQPAAAGSRADAYLGFFGQRPPVVVDRNVDVPVVVVAVGRRCVKAASLSLSL